ncbi:MAG: energy transducer TonB [Planctomycetes bacterium]|nr:energy transducer TonB [Planctomycetota bacterium]
MRTSWLLVSIAVHGAAISAALGVGVYAHQQAQRPVARIEFRNAPPSAPPQTQATAAPDVEAEDPRDEAPLVEVPVDVAVEPEAQQDPVIEPSPLPATASSVLNRATRERVRRPVDPPVEQPAPVATETVEPAPQPVEEQPSEPAYTSATRADRGGPPAYPEKERRLAREGKVVLRVAVAADGSVSDVRLQTPSRYAGFNRAALKAARGWRFDPATRDGVPVASETDVEVVFVLTDPDR